MFEAIAFYLFSFLTILMFAITVLSANTLYSLSALAAGMLFISAFYFLLGADFLGAVQIIVYTGAVMALYAFAMMFFDLSREVNEKKSSAVAYFGLSGMIALLVIVIVMAPVVSTNMESVYAITGAAENPQAIGMVLFTKYLVPFEVAAIMLLVAMIAGIVLAGKKMDHSLTLMKEEEISLMQEESK